MRRVEKERVDSSYKTKSLHVLKALPGPPKGRESLKWIRDEIPSLWDGESMNTNQSRG